MNIGVIGFGVVGSATGKGLAKFGNNIIFSDKNPKIIEKYSERFPHRENYNINETDATFIAVPTGKYETRGSEIDTSCLDNVINDLGEKLRFSKKYHNIVMRSTVLPGMTRTYGKKLEQLSGKRLGIDFGIAMNPEFLRAFNDNENIYAVNPDFEKPNVTVIGGIDQNSINELKKAYSQVDNTIHERTLEEAEEIKLFHNNLNAAKISFFNELFLISQHMDIPIDEKTLDPLRLKIIDKSKGLQTSALDKCNNKRSCIWGTSLNSYLTGQSLEDTFILHSNLLNNGFNSDLLSSSLSLKRSRYKNGGRLKYEDLDFTNLELLSEKFASAFDCYKIALFMDRKRINRALNINFNNVRKTVIKSAESLTNPTYGTYGGMAYGGTCLPKDSIFFEKFLMQNGIYSPLTESFINVNEKMIALGFSEKKFEDLPEYLQKRNHSTYNNVSSLKKTELIST